MNAHRRRSAPAKLPRFCVIALTLVALGQDLAKAAPRARTQAQTSQEELTSFTREVAAPSSLPEGGYLPYRSPPELDHTSCQPSVVKDPVRGRLDRAVVLAAREQLNLPMGVGRLLVVHGQPYLFCLEPHYHPPGYGLGPEGWHKGVTVYRGSLEDARVL